MFRGALLVASDSARDLAVLRIDAYDAPSIRLGNSGQVRVGAPVLLLGAPRGLEESATTGIVSAVRTDSSGTRLIQTSAPASPGSSGGPLLNDSGEVIGVLSFGVTQSQNLNFAVPINYARGILDRISSVTTAPIATLGALTGPDQVSVAPVAAPSAERNSGGIFVTGFGTRDYLEQVYLGITEVLAEGSIRVVELSAVRSGAQVRPISAWIEAARDARADGVLFFTLSTGYGQTDRLRVQCYTSDGTLMWQEEAVSRWQMTVEGAVGAITNGMKRKLRARIANQEFPGLQSKRD